MTRATLSAGMETSLRIKSLALRASVGVSVRVCVCVCVQVCVLDCHLFFFDLEDVSSSRAITPLTQEVDSKCFV